MSKTRSMYPLSPKKILKKTLVSSIGKIFLLLVFWVALAIFVSTSGKDISQWFGLSVLIVLFFSFLIVLLTYVYQRWYFAVYFYDLTEDYIQIRKGPITPREITIPYQRIQDVYVDQDLFDRIFGLYDVHLSSATFASGMEAHIDGVEKDAAEGLRSELLEIVRNRISKDKNTGMPVGGGNAS